MRRERRLFEAGAAPVPFDDIPHPLPRECHASGVDKQDVAPFTLVQEFESNREVAFDRDSRVAPEGDESLLVTLSRHDRCSRLEVEIGEANCDGLCHAGPRRVQEFENRNVSETEPGRPIRRIQQTLDLLDRERLREGSSSAGSVDQHRGIFHRETFNDQETVVAAHGSQFSGPRRSSEAAMRELSYEPTDPAGRFVVIDEVEIVAQITSVGDHRVHRETSLRSKGPKELLRVRRQRLHRPAASSSPATVFASVITPVRTCSTASSRRILIRRA